MSDICVMHNNVELVRVRSSSLQIMAVRSQAFELTYGPSGVPPGGWAKRENPPNRNHPPLGSLNPNLTHDL